MRVVRLGIGYRHQEGFTVDRPAGAGDYLLLHFLTPVQALTADGVVRGGPGDCLLYGPRDRQWYRGDGEGLGNDWVHFAGRRVAATLAHYRLPRNRLFRPQGTSRVPSLLHRLQYERQGDLPYRAEAEGLALESLLLTLGRGLGVAQEGALTPRLSDLRDRLQSLRARLHEFPHSAWTVRAMAETAHLSSSRFSTLYRRFFGTSPMDDLITARLERACWLLQGGNATVGEVAAACGFHSIYHFSRLFKARFGCPPSRWK